MAAIYVNGVKTSCMAIGEPSPLQFKTWAKFNGHPITLSISLHSDYQVKCVFYQDVEEEVECILGTSLGGTTYNHLTVYDHKYYATNDRNWGPWTSGEHTFIHNDANGNETFDGTTVVTGAMVQTNDSDFYTIGIRRDDNRCIIHGTYIKSYQIYDKTNDIMIMDLVPCLFDNTEHCLYDRINKRFYYPEGLTVMDTIPTT